MRNKVFTKLLMTASTLSSKDNLEKDCKQDNKDNTKRRKHIK